MHYRRCNENCNLDDFQMTTTRAITTPTPKPTSIPSKMTPSQAENHTTFKWKTKISHYSILEFHFNNYYFCNMPSTAKEKTPLSNKQQYTPTNAVSLILYTFHFEEGSLIHSNSYQNYFSGTLLFLTTSIIITFIIITCYSYNRQFYSRVL